MGLCWQAGRQESRHDIDRRDYCYYWHRRRRQGQTRTTGEILQLLLLRCMTVESRRGTGRGVPGREFASQAECSWSVPWRWEWQCRWDWGIGAWGWGWQCDHGSWIMLDRQMDGRRRMIITRGGRRGTGRVSQRSPVRTPSGAVFAGLGVCSVILLLVLQLRWLPRWFERAAAPAGSPDHSAQTARRS